MASKKLIDALNRARKRELGVVLQYMRQHYMAQGIESPPVAEIFKDIAKTEMKHAEDLAERVAYLGGEPTNERDPVKASNDLRQMLKDDLQVENEAVKMYRDTIALCRQEGDVTSRTMMEKILAEEEEHVDTFTRLLAK
jgi:bacterioferritin